MACKKKSLDSYLGEVYKEFIAIKDDDFKKAQEVFSSVFDQVKQKMHEQCNYFKKYSSQVMFAGSVFDNIKVSKMDEFDMDIVIRLPINYADGENGIIIENDQPGFVKLKIMNAFDHLDKQKEWENCHKVTREWRDSEKYFLQSKFRRWMHGIVQKALNVMEGKVTVNGVVYLLAYKESGPAYTLHIRNDIGDEEFKLDVDLVPVIKFSFPRAPDGYRMVEGLQSKDWLVVPKPNKAASDHTSKSRCWRLSFQNQERELIRDRLALKTTIRLLKKMRDALEMKAIASYYIKTLFLWKVAEKEHDKTYWRSKVSFHFQVMVEELYNAIKNKTIPFYWNKKHNLIESLKPTLQKIYTDKLKDVLASITANDPDKLITYLLTKDELKEFKTTEFYVKQCELSNGAQQSVVVESRTPPLELPLSDHVKLLNKELEEMRAKYQKEKEFSKLESKINDLADRVSLVEDRLDRLELMARGQQNVGSNSDNMVNNLASGVRTLMIEPKLELIDFLTPMNK